MSSAGLLQAFGGIRVNSKVIGNINLVYSHTLIFTLMAHSVSILVLFGNGSGLNRKN